jgi:uncharacterized membrane protein
MFDRFAADTRGNIAILFSLLFGAMSVATALAIDSASLYLERRRIQGAVDIAAISAAQNPDNAFDIAAQVILDHGLIPAGLSVEDLSKPESEAYVSAEVGAYRMDRAIPVDERFSMSASGRNAVRVTYRARGELFFAAPWAQRPTISAQAVASSDARAAFSLGTRAASLSDGFPNAVLNQLLGTQLQLTALDYNALASVRLDALTFLDALAIRMNLTAGTYADVLNATATQSQIGDAISDVVNAADQIAVQGLLQKLGTRTVRVGNLVSLGGLADTPPGHTRGQINTIVSALDILRASAILSDGVKQVQLPIGLTIPGLASFNIELAIGEPLQNSGWLSVGEIGATVRSAQVRLLIKVQISGSLGILTLIPIKIELPVYIEAAQSEARLIELTCPTSASPYGTAKLEVRPGLARIRIGQILPNTLAEMTATPASTPAKILNVLGLIGASAIADVQVSQSTAVVVSFSSSDIMQRRTKTASTRTIVGSLSTSLLGSTRIWLDLLAIPLLSQTKALESISALITPIAPALDTVINGLTDALGVRIGEADVTVHGVTCSLPTLKS